MIKKLITSLLIVATVISMNPIGVSAEWKQDSNGWWYKDGKSWVTGWKEIDGNWYYFNGDGYMAHDTAINGYYLNSNGIWSENISIEDAKKILKKHDSNIEQYSILKYGGEIKKNKLDTWPYENKILSMNQFYNLTGDIEDMYYFNTSVFDNYLVGENTGKVYYYCSGNRVFILESYDDNGNVLNTWTANDMKTDIIWEHVAK